LVHKIVKLNPLKLTQIELKLGVVQLTQPITYNGWGYPKCGPRSQQALFEHKFTLGE
jgi:hypothetical protein